MKSAVFALLSLLLVAGCLTAPAPEIIVTVDEEDAIQVPE